ncbi:hypothetical protein U9M48_043176 [Paspalum notatum var. saurae]|uniref:Integrase catalytic domain-containing protein n=1 Tax=Paspalum notatum var. saurae TaxID=547442 RepID=A0AAQ3XIC8_PASNO
MEDVWIMDSGCSRHMTRNRKWFSSLNPVSTKEYITFGDNGQGFEVRFKKGVCRVLDAKETLVYSLLPFGQVMTSYPVELLHMDTVCPARVVSVSGKWYVLVVVDDFSRFSWVFFMEFKNEAFGFVRDLVLRLRNKSHKAMRAIHSDNGGEFRNSQFKSICRDLGPEP